jgi:small GTP-binding protein
LTQRYIGHKFSNNYKSTIGSDFSTKTIAWKDKFNVTLYLWDLAGQDRLNAQVKVYYRGADGALCVSDISRPKTKEQVVRWKDRVLQDSTRSDGTTNMPPCIMLINKIDLLKEDETQGQKLFKQFLTTSIIDHGSDIVSDIVANDNNTITSQDPPLSPTTIDFSDETMPLAFNELAKKLGFLAGVPTSAKDKTGIDNAIEMLIEEMIRRREEDIQLGINESQREGVVDLTGWEQSKIDVETSKNKNTRRCNYC